MIEVEAINIDIGTWPERLGHGKNILLNRWGRPERRPRTQPPKQLGMCIHSTAANGCPQPYERFSSRPFASKAIFCSEPLAHESRRSQTPLRMLVRVPTDVLHAIPARLVGA